MDTTNIGRSISKRRTKLDLSQNELAEMAKVSRNYISLIERGEATNISTSILNRLAIALKTTPRELLRPMAHTDQLIPESLRTLAIEDGLSYAIVDKLNQIPRRGKEPKSVKEWRDLYESIKDYLEDV